MKPILKWAGGKSQLLGEITSRFPSYVQSQSFCLIEPFVGGGAVSIWALENLPCLKKLVINDYNADLIDVYQSIQKNPQKLIEELSQLQSAYDALKTLEEKKPFYYAKRDLFNQRTEPKVKQASLFIFLNKSGFNGLYRVNKSNQFNVPIGNYKQPIFLDRENIFALSEKLQDVKILVGDFSQTLNFIPKDMPCLFYIDPPYRPVSKTSNFTAYSDKSFDDYEQRRLAKFCQQIHALGHQFILSNSDPKNCDANDNYFDDLYCDFYIERIQAGRAISAKSSGRRRVSELLISNL